MLDGIKKTFTPAKIVLVAVTDKDEMYVFDRANFQGKILNKATCPWGTNPDNRGQNLVRQVAAAHNRKCTTVRSRALAEGVYFTFWFPKPGTWKLEEWQGKVACLTDESLVTKAHRRVVETALIKARDKMTADNLAPLS